MSISEYSLNRPVTMMMVAISAVVLGLVAFDRLPVEQYPTISSSGITATAQYNSSSPEEVERKVTIPLEAALGTLNNIESMTSSSSRSSGSVRINFKAGTDMDLANMAMRERLDQARAFMPPDLDRLRLRRWQSDQSPTVYANLAWHGEGDRLLDVITKVIEPRLLRLNGVANVVIDDLDEKQLIVELDREQLQSRGVSLADLGRQLRENNVTLSVGRVVDGGQRYMARVVSEFQNAEEIGLLPLMDGRFRLRDIGEIVYGYPEKTSYERLNGIDALQLEVFKASTANVVDMGQAVSAELLRIEAEYEGKLEVAIVRNRADTVLGEAGTLANTALLGALLAMSIIFLFLRNIRSTLVVALAIPTSALCVFIGMYLAREVFESTITLNMVSMMGLMLAVGMLVDPAVVVLESIYRHRQEEGLESLRAALIGTREVGMAVLASALTTTCVFVPFFFLSDSRSATWMRDAGLTICLAVLVSMLVALTLLPLATSRLFREGMERYDRYVKLVVVAAIAGVAGLKLQAIGRKGLLAWWERWSGLVGDSIRGMEWTTSLGLALTATTAVAVLWYCRRHGLRSSYARLLGWTLDHRWVALLAAVALTATGYHLYGQIEHRGTPRTPERRVEISVRIDRSYSLDEVREHFTQIEGLIMARQDELDIESLTTRFRQRRGSIRAYLVEADDGRLSTMEAGNAVMALLPERVGYTYKMGRSRSWQGNMLGVEVQLRGRDAEVLEMLVEDVTAGLAAMPGVQDVDSSL
ncbi:efflux RND transporter permease subunit, partial [Candidatus Latescibacterota bacterium]